MKLISYMPMQEWLRALSNKRRSILEFGEERFYGFLWKNFFYVTYASGHEWNRRITNEKNRAVGLAIDKGQETHLYYLHFRGSADPISVLIGFAMTWLVLAILGFPLAEFWLLLLFVPGVLILSGLEEGITDRGKAGEEVLWRILMDPREYYCIK